MIGLSILHGTLAEAAGSYSSLSFGYDGGANRRGSFQHRTGYVPAATQFRCGFYGDAGTNTRAANTTDYLKEVIAWMTNDSASNISTDTAYNIDNTHFNKIKFGRATNGAIPLTFNSFSLTTTGTSTVTLDSTPDTALYVVSLGDLVFDNITDISGNASGNPGTTGGGYGYAGAFMYLSLIHI